MTYINFRKFEGWYEIPIYLTSYEVESLEKHLSEHFNMNDIEIKKELTPWKPRTSLGVDLKFKRREDEAFFLIWSSDGIEI